MELENFIAKEGKYIYITSCYGKRLCSSRVPNSIPSLVWDQTRLISGHGRGVRSDVIFVEIYLALSLVLSLALMIFRRCVFFKSGKIRKTLTPACPLPTILGFSFPVPIICSIRNIPTVFWLRFLSPHLFPWEVLVHGRNFILII